jgi:hypothetical protein
MLSSTRLYSTQKDTKMHVMCCNWKMLSLIFKFLHFKFNAHGASTMYFRMQNFVKKKRAGSIRGIGLDEESNFVISWNNRGRSK